MTRRAFLALRVIAKHGKSSVNMSVKKMEMSRRAFLALRVIAKHGKSSVNMAVKKV